METNRNITSARKKEIAAKYIEQLDKHIAELKSGMLDNPLGISDIANMLCISSGHLSDTIKEVLGKSPCGVYEEKLVETSKELLSQTDKPIGEIAAMLTYDPSNFTKFFKRYTNLTPSQYRKESVSG
jgi:AraC-like DNA-binding protein